MTQPKPSLGLTAVEKHPLEAELEVLKARVANAEKQIQALAEATLVPARGMEAGPLEAPDQLHPEHAARLAHELLLAADLVPPTGGTKGGTP
jgi:hypothetical protein